ncbi:Senescence regulator [Heracleum sosnowskyi]|uniref:Senescence regulator n=1 Tax=Heracleum sosnowskyi TaxID=360622 RepID=A0AAD8HWG1_9APIA|nr:Senescence regulator [Heracleum sosnowskyi]
MAASKTYRFLPTSLPLQIHSDPIYELDETEIWNSGRSTSPEFRRTVPRNKSTANKVEFVFAGEPATAKSLPVNVPDWSKILKGEYVGECTRNDDVEDDVAGYDWVAPHEYLARTRVASYSVHEGVGRTLKGRDLSRVRNAIWEKTGFQD